MKEYDDMIKSALAVEEDEYEEEEEQPEPGNKLFSKIILLMGQSFENFRP